MSNTLDLKQIEQKAVRSTYQDGLLDILWGYFIMAVAIFMNHPASGYSPLNIVWLVLIFAAGQAFYWAAKKYITQPRMGRVQFGTIRRQKNKTLSIILGVVVLIQTSVVVLTAIGWRNPTFGKELFGDANYERLAVAALGSLFVGPPMMFVAHMIDFRRGYYIAMLFALAVFLMIYINQPIYPLIIGGLILVPGLVIFIRFLRMYPIPHEDVSNG